ncbi:hypothetical protein HYT45_04750 [Candidatus Uhrbacteria bacterium]|nr:hypothetical protein [Candidatus Uhrbacteria bacterium]
MPPKKVQDIIAPRPGSKIPQRISREKVDQSLIRTSSKFSRSGPDVLPRRRFPRIAIWGSLVFAVVVLVFAFSTFFENATVRVTQKQETASFDGIVVARRGGEETPPNILNFELMEIRETVSKEVEAKTLEYVERRASGSVIVYNNYSKQSQRLIKNTRFEAPDGKIYRIRESVVVPGQRQIDGKTTPGQTEVVIYADEPGVEYNKDLSDFTIPGFKGTAHYGTFYARGKTPLHGGFRGNVKTVGAAKLARVRDELQDEAKKRLLASAQAQKPENFALFPDAVFVLFSDAEAPLKDKEGHEGARALVSEEAVLYGIIFEKEKFGEFLTEKLDLMEAGGRIVARNIEDLDFKIIDKTNFDPENDTQFSFTLKGKPQFVWEFDAEELREELRTVPKSQLAAVLLGFPSITRAEVTFRPFWKRSFPEKGEDIVIEKVVEE